jgi:hypothetical protein
VKVAGVLQFPRFVCANFAQKTLSTETNNVLFLRIAKVLPVKTLIAGTHAPTAVPAFIRLTNSPARALDGEKLQLLCHTHLQKPILTYSEDVKRRACKGFTTDLWH